MILKSSMTQELLDHFISKIDSKHQTIGIKDRGLALDWVSYITTFTVMLITDHILLECIKDS